ncbi:acyltransferase [Marinilongibacter aquaticus]|uniref:acyltransferase n=1 Tax=Marinilongibacter aquaticus TaxID=2975157 RepID=UPI0021BD7AE8|nr:acyltransferase [Marinilongibacter aquaticus]UBM60736.1 acyltransferase [Marinilongibacter aquaticus]
MNIQEILESRPNAKRFVHRLLFAKNEAKPRAWVQLFLNPFFHQRGKSSKIRKRVRRDLIPFRKFSLGEESVVEDFSTLNNGVGDLHIGARSLIGLGNVIIGPVTIGSNTILAQHIVISGLNHLYENPEIPIRDQGVSTSPVEIGDNCWIGANCVITAGVKIGKHVIVGAGSVVTKDIPPYSVAVGNPARIIKTFDFEQKNWVKVP